MYDELFIKGKAIKSADTSDLVKKTDYNTKLAEIEKKIRNHYNNNKYITTQEFNRLTAEYFAARLNQANLATKADIANKQKVQIKKLLQIN